MSARMRQLTDASTLFQSGHLDLAASKCRRVLARNHQDADAMQLMGLISARQGGIASAVQWIGSAVQVAGPRVDLCLNLARLLQAQGRPESAIACYFQAIEVAPANGTIWLSLGRLLMSLGRSEAVGCFRQVLELAGSPAELAEAQMQLGHIHHAAGDAAAAAEC